MPQSSPPAPANPTLLCDLDDIMRYLRNEAVSDADKDTLDAYIEEASEYAAHVTRQDFRPAGTVITQSFFDVREDSRLRVRELYPQNVTLSVFSNSQSINLDVPDWVLTGPTYFVVENNGWIRLTFSPYYAISGGTSFGSFAMGRRLPITWDRIDVTYTCSGIIPATVREATALIAGAFYTQGVFDISSFTSESLGEYHYSRSPRDPQAAVIPIKARHLLRLFRGTHSRTT